MYQYIPARVTVAIYRSVSSCPELPDSGSRRGATAPSRRTRHAGRLSAVLDLDAVSPLKRLSAREIQVLKLVVEGRTSKEIARVLGVLPSTVDTYRSRLMRKLAVDDVPTLVRLAIRHGLIEL